MSASTYTRTYTTFGGADIMATFNGRVVGELQAITYSVTREKVPVYTMGDPNPRSFSRGKRGIAGSIVFTVFDRDALHQLKAEPGVFRHAMNSSAEQQNPTPVHEYNLTIQDIPGRWKEKVRPKYTDEIPPFDITINFMNEYGNSSKMTIYGVEILNEGMGMSIDDITTEKACTFVARDIEDMVPDVYDDIR
ncbi:virion structural protein_gp101 [Bacillus phage vB_BceM_WH1]|nr:virion structural protein_gp101 [Bacillus phage vB_BceM_WH1]